MHITTIGARATPAGFRRLPTLPESRRAARRWRRSAAPSGRSRLRRAGLSPSGAQRREVSRRIALAGSRAGPERRRERIQLRPAEDERGGGDVLLEPLLL